MRTLEEGRREPEAGEAMVARGEDRMRRPGVSTGASTSGRNSKASSGGKSSTKLDRIMRADVRSAAPDLGVFLGVLAATPPWIANRNKHLVAKLGIWSGQEEV